MQKIVFCFPYRGVGGVSLLFLRVAEDLASKGMAETYLVDYTDGFMAHNRRDGLCGFIEYRDDGHVVLPEDAVVVFQSMTPWSLYPALRFSPQTRMLFWNCHPFNLIPTLPGLRLRMQKSPVFAQLVLNTLLFRYRQIVKKLVQRLVSGRSLVFMDRANISTTENYLGLSLAEPVFLPIAVTPPQQQVEAKLPNFHAQGLRIAWIGRLVDFKYPILKHALSALDRVQSEMPFPIHVTVVGSGEYEHHLRVDIAKLKHLSVKVIDHIAPNRIDDFLAREVDILMAMGTSALEGAKLGVPTLLLDMSYNQVPSGYVFQWLHKRTGFTLGDVIGSEHIVPGNRSLAERIIEAERDYADISQQTKAYFNDFHSTDAVADSLLYLTKNASCTYRELAAAGLGRRGILYSMFTFLRTRMATQ